MVSVASENERFALRLVDLLSDEEALGIAAHIIRQLGPCRCDPPGSGEEHCTGHCELSRELQQARAALRGMMEIAELAMPDTYFQADSRVNAARACLPVGGAMTDTAPSAVDKRLRDAASEYVWRRFPEAPGAMPYVETFEAGAAWRAQSSEHEAERRRLEQAVVEAAKDWERSQGKHEGRLKRAVDALETFTATYDAERAEEP